MTSSEESDRLFSVTAENLRLIRSKLDSAERIYPQVFNEFAAIYSADIGEGEFDSETIGYILTRLFGEGSWTQYDLALLCRALSSAYRGDRNEYFGAAPHTQSLQSMHTSYLKNALSDKAYCSFASLYPTAVAVYFPSFREVCEEIYYGRCSHAILPVYNSEEGQLQSFARLIEKYELKILHETEIETNDSSVMRFALLSKNIVLPTKKERFLSLSVVADDTRIGELVRIISVFGAEIASMNTRPLDYSSKGCFVDTELDMSGADIYGLRMFLESSLLRYEIYGIYDII